MAYMLTWLGYIDGIHVTIYSIYSIHGSYGLYHLFVVSPNFTKDRLSLFFSYIISCFSQFLYIPGWSTHVSMSRRPGFWSWPCWIAAVPRSCSWRRSTATLRRTRPSARTGRPARAPGWSDTLGRRERKIIQLRFLNISQLFKCQYRFYQ